MLARIITGSPRLEIAIIDAPPLAPLTSIRYPTAQGRTHRTSARALLACALALPWLMPWVLVGPAAAESQAEPGLQPIEAIAPPPPVRSGEVLEPEVTIVQDHRGTVQEYRVGGRLVGVKITPRDAPAYYLVDADGDGHLETRRYEHGSDILVNAWMLFSWK